MAPGQQIAFPGEASLVESWTRLAATSPQACVTHLEVGVAAIFPE
jgi:hypothetical protein